MAKKRKAKKAAKAKKRAAKRTAKRAAPARRSKAPARKAKAKSKRRVAKTKLPPRSAAPGAPRPMNAPGPAVTPIAARPSPFPSSVPGDFPTQSPDGKN